uniref:Integrase, catalytic region, zinc finger, CCHC-type, peptidase aspartic, catalytic n=1 Tax=Tanacetum cinerariifolium TaxID=118510 RepID=A0A6L2MFT0_TANCI|nr:hypothetical protein [Tanacetum cinerariifolium]
MASKQFSLEPGLSKLNEMGKSSNRSVSKVDEASKNDLEDLFQDFYDEYFDSSKIMKSSTTNVETPINEDVFHELILIFCEKVEMSRDVLTVGSTMRISLLYRGEYSQWVERFMNYLDEQTDGEAMINLIKNGDQPLPRVTQVSIAGTTSTEQPPLKDKSMWSAQEKIVQKIDRLEKSLLIQGLPNDIYSLIDSNKTAKDLWDALARHMLGSEYGEQDRKAAVLYNDSDQEINANMVFMAQIEKVLSDSEASSSSADEKISKEKANIVE